ncbi:MAG: PQQ-binding-like beta-propeller repeat protein [Acidobacteriota bacterium]|nr:MAG: PQQ-binding-like beta-propeller repeat protein [Acidobacteriota bacterium]
MINRCFLVVFALFCLLSACIAGSSKEVQVQSWPGFRGRRASGIAEGHPTPATWDLEKSWNVLWKVPIPGLAHSSPIVWGDSIFVTTALSERPDQELRVGLYGDIAPVADDSIHRWCVLRIDRKTGEVLWEKTAHQGVPKIKRHPKSTHANPSPATDGRRVVAFFGSEGLYCFDFEGNLLWKVDLGVLDSAFFVAPAAQWGFASSPVIEENRVYVQIDVLGDSFVAAFSLDDGSELWRTTRKDVPTWSTPTVQQVGQRSQVIVNGWKHIGAYDASTGEEIWKLTGGGDIPVPTPVVGHGLVFITNAHGPASPIYAVRLEAQGDISLNDGASSNESIAWSVARGGAYMQTPLVYGDYLYNCRDNGVLSCYEAKTGKLIYQERLGRGAGGFSASPVAADGKIYFSSETGDVYVVRAGPAFEVLAVNSFDEVLMATPAVSQGQLFFRTRGHLIALGE